MQAQAHQQESHSSSSSSSSLGEAKSHQKRAHQHNSQTGTEPADEPMRSAKSTRKMSTPIKRQAGERMLGLPIGEWSLPGVFLSALLSCLVLLVLVAQTSYQLEGAPGGEQEIQKAHRRLKRALYELPDGSEQLLSSSLRTTFTCDGLGYGYYADQDNECKIFHICQSFKMSDGSIYNNHWSFICPNQTMFNQVSLACSHPEDSIPCENAKEFYHVNDYFGDVRAPSVRDSDLSLASDLISRSYGSRLSPGQ